MIRTISIAAIRLYQLYISTRKGYACAHRIHTGRAGCSELGCGAIRRFDVFAGLRVLNRRLHRCGQEHRRNSPVPHRPPRWQRGDCDIGCIDLPNIDCQPGRLLSAADCCSSGCDWPWRRDKDKKR